MEAKKWYTSKMIWVNVILVIASIAQAKMGLELGAETQAVILGVVNVVLRSITKTPVKW